MNEQVNSFRALVENAWDIIARFDRDFRYLYINLACSNYFPLKPEDFIGKTLQELGFPEEKAQSWEKTFQEVFETGKPQTLELEVESNKGIFYFEWRISPEFDKDGKVKTIVTIARDITERKRLGETVKESERFLETIVENAPVCIKLITLDGILLRMNKAGLAMIGADSLDQVKGVSIYSLVSSEYREAFETLTKDVFNGKSGTLVLKMVGLKGRHFWLETHAVPLYNDRGEIIALLGLTLDITARKQAEETLRLERTKLVNILDTMEDGVNIVNQNYDMEYANPTIIRNFGYYKKGQKCYSYLFGNENVCSWCKNQKVFQGETVHWEHTFPTLQKIFDILDVPLQNPDGSISKLEIFRDISGRKHAEELLRKERDRAEKYLDVAGVMIITLDAAGEVTLVNRKGCEILGYGEEDIIGKDWFDYFLPERIRVEMRGFFLQLMAGDIEPVEYYENPVLTKKHEEKIIAFHNTVIEDQQGNIIGILFSGEDITERKRAQESLKLSEEKYRIVADNTYDWEFWISPDDNCIYTSPSCSKITGYSSGAFEKDPTLIYRLVHPEDMNIFKAHRHVARDMREMEEIDFRIVRPDGSIRWIGHSCQPVYDEQGKFIGTRGSNKDITLRKQVEEEKEKLIVDLRNALDRVKQLSGLLPICSSCKKIRDDKGYWIQIESYIHSHSEAEFSHGICPECAKKLYPQYYDKVFGEDTKEKDK